MRNMTPENIAEACGGILSGCEALLGKEITLVTTDSRKAVSGSLYIPMKGTRDGHDFIPGAMANGAALTLTEREEAAAGYPYIKVKRTDIAIQRIAEFYRKQFDIPVVGITGSVGKTSTKEMIAAMLGEKYCVLKTEKNFNNNLGLPLTLFNLRPEHEAAVVEMGISHFGEMTDLARTARPDIMVIGNIGTCHLEFLKDRDGVFAAKTECFEYLRSGGTVVLNGDDDKLAQVKDVHGRAPVFYGRSPRCRVTVENEIPRGFDGTDITVSVDDREFPVHVPLAGEHFVMNALAAAAVGSLLGLTDEEIARGIAKTPAPTFTWLWWRAKPSMPGTRKRNTGASLRKPPQIAPRRAFVMSFAESVRWMMNWSVHQYHTPIVTDATTTPSHGNALCVSECQRPNASTLPVDLIVCFSTAQPSAIEFAAWPSTCTPELPRW